MSFLNDVKISVKLTVSFALVIVMLLTLAVISFTGMKSVFEGFVDYRGLARDTNLAGRLQANMLMVRMNVKDFLITGSQKDVDQYRFYVERMNTFLEEAKVEIQKPERAKLVSEIVASVGDYEKNFATVIQMRAQRDKMVKNVLNPKGLSMRQNLTDIMHSAFKDKDSTAAYYTGRMQEHLLLARLYVLKFLDTNDIASVERADKEFFEIIKPYRILEKELQNRGRRKLLAEFNRDLKIYSDTFHKLKDLIFERNDIIKNQLDRIGPVIAKAAEDVKLSVKADQDKVGPAVQTLAEDTLNNTMMVAIGSFVISVLLGIFLFKAITSLTTLMVNLVNDLFNSADQVASASNEISMSSQALSQGASVQAASLEETSSTMEQISSQSKHNATNAKMGAVLVEDMNEMVTQSTTKAAEAKQLSVAAKTASENGVEAIGKIAQAMRDIKHSSDKVSDIIEVINEITQQTKMLSTNAAIEAARAGELGKGFAVVADEVSKLAENSKTSAKEISSLIKESSQMATKGDELSHDGEKVLQEIYSNVEQVTLLIDEVSDFSEAQGIKMPEVKTVVDGIALASNEQANGVDQVNQAMVQMDQVTQSNAATSEEAAASSEELNAQAEALRSLISEAGKHFGITRESSAQKANSTIELLPHTPGPKKTVKPEDAIPLNSDFKDF